MWRHRRQQSQFVQVSEDGRNCTRAQAQSVIQWMKQSRSEFISGKNDICITSEYDLSDGRIRARLVPNELKIFSIHVENKSKESVTFVQYKVLRRMRVFSFQDEHNVSKICPLLLHPGDVYKIIVRCSTSHYGYFPVTLVFEFMRQNDASHWFHIGRFLSAVSNSKLAEDLAPVTTYVPYQRNLLKPFVRIEDEGFPPDNSLNYELEREIPLGEFSLPPYLKTSIRAGLFSSNDGSTRFSIRTQDRTVLDLKHLNQYICYVLQDGIFAFYHPIHVPGDLLSSSLDFSNYNKKFQLMLYLEEMQMEVDIRKYDQTDQLLELDPRDKRFLILTVPGVAENRPSVLKGDHLFVTLSDERGKPGIISYKGYVHAVELEKVKLGFSQNLLKRFITGLHFDVVFTFNRLPLKIQHRSVELAEDRNLGEILFPTTSYGKCITDPQRLRLYDQNLESNPEQYNAVKQIVSGISRPAPYLIFGPPGTGKTVTLVEAIKQVLKCIPNSHVLACAPSNSAADLLCERLIKHVKQRDIYRIVASSRDFRTVPENIKACCNWDSSNECYIYPSKYDLKKYKVIIATLVTAGRLVSADFPKGHFSHVFIDEAGQAVEPECVTAIAGILSVMNQKTNMNGGQLVLAGDPQQLGPIIRSPVAIEHGLGISLLERLMTQNPLYKKENDHYDPKFVTKLLRNYRSHPNILTIPNELFYDNELQANADELVSHSYSNWEKLPHKGFPIIFHGVLGKDEREGTSPSFFNVIEIEELLSYVEAMLQTQGKNGLAKISPKDIGIISPYRKQVEKIRQAINIKFKTVAEIKDLKVGSVEEFQGQEKKVILISTVRSSPDYVKFDEDFNLGFLKNPKRFNVAITRAKALLILVGNPLILGKDPNWSLFLRYCSDNGGCTGFQLEDEDEFDDSGIAELLNNLDLSGPLPAGASDAYDSVFVLFLLFTPCRSFFSVASDWIAS
ncbi:putative helicase MOV-10 [Rhinophrynus dorsalis]